MLVLNKPVHNVTVADIEELCQQGTIEGIQLDYKKEVPRDLSKHFAAMSNTRGGLIIIGVEEDEKTGKPIKWDSIPYDDKIIDRIHQFASNVDPIPSYDVVTTGENTNGNVFVLVRVFEGDRTPYYVQNDANLWVRTGNISKRIDLASPKEVELLLGKKENARLARENSLKRCQDIQKAASERANRKRIEAAKRRATPLECAFANKTRSAQCTILLQPYFPHPAYIAPRELLSKLHELRVESSYGDIFPEQSGEPVPDGVLIFRSDSQSGESSGQQLHANGTLYEARDIVKPWSHLEAVSSPHLAQVTVYEQQLATHLWTVLRSAQKFYALLGYNGSLCGAMTLHGVQGMRISHLTSSGNPLMNDLPAILLSDYNWTFQLDTAQLADDATLENRFVEFSHEVSWGLGNKSDIGNALRALAETTV